MIQTAREKLTIKLMQSYLKVVLSSMFWISVFLLMPTVTTYFIDWKWLRYGIDTGIVILFISMWWIRRGIKKKEKLDKLMEMKKEGEGYV